MIWSLKYLCSLWMMSNGCKTQIFLRTRYWAIEKYFRKRSFLSTRMGHVIKQLSLLPSSAQSQTNQTEIAGSHNESLLFRFLLFLGVEDGCGGSTGENTLLVIVVLVFSCVFHVICASTFVLLCNCSPLPSCLSFWHITDVSSLPLSWSSQPWRQLVT